MQYGGLDGSPSAVPQHNDGDFRRLEKLDEKLDKKLDNELDKIGEKLNKKLDENNLIITNQFF